jgi:hypothetical protein
LLSTLNNRETLERLSEALIVMEGKGRLHDVMAHPMDAGQEMARIPG